MKKSEINTRMKYLFYGCALLCIMVVIYTSSKPKPIEEPIKMEQRIRGIAQIQ